MQTSGIKQVIHKEHKKMICGDYVECTLDVEHNNATSLSRDNEVRVINVHVVMVMF